MEVEINKEILNIREGVFFGLPLRELLAVIVAMICSLIVYLAFGNVVLCAIVSAIPIVAGFVTYHGMNGGRTVITIVMEMLRPRTLTASRSDMSIDLRQVMYKK